jgi:hypothetical protein
MIAALIGFGVAGGIAIVAVHGRQHADRRATAVSCR